MSKLPETVLIACQKLGLEPDEVREHKEYGDRVVIITTEYAKMTIELGASDLEGDLPTTLEKQASPGLTKMTVAELRDLARDLFVPGYSSLKKADLIEEIKDASGAK